MASTIIFFRITVGSRGLRPPLRRSQALFAALSPAHLPDKASTIVFPLPMQLLGALTVRGRESD